MSTEEQLRKMREDWDQRAKENARYYVNTATAEWTDEEFFASGEQTVADEILTDLVNICQGKLSKDMRVLEIGCGAGRVTRALASLFGEVHGVDVRKPWNASIPSRNVTSWSAARRIRLTPPWPCGIR